MFITVYIVYSVSTAWQQHDTRCRRRITLTTFCFRSSPARSHSSAHRRPQQPPDHCPVRAGLSRRLPRGRGRQGTATDEVNHIEIKEKQIIERT